MEGPAARMILLRSAENSSSLGQLVHNDAGMIILGQDHIEG